MAEQRKSRVDSSVQIGIEDLKALDPDVLSELQEKYGLEIEVRSASAAIERILGGLKGVGSVSQAADFTRGFDRTSDMYWKAFDRDYAMLDPAELVSRPAEAVRRIPLGEALERFSLEELARLKQSGR